LLASNSTGRIIKAKTVVKAKSIMPPKSNLGNVFTRIIPNNNTH
jgi:hypothetical protein